MGTFQPQTPPTQAAANNAFMQEMWAVQFK